MSELVRLSGKPGRAPSPGTSPRGHLVSLQFIDYVMYLSRASRHCATLPTLGLPSRSVRSLSTRHVASKPLRSQQWFGPRQRILRRSQSTEPVVTKPTNRKRSTTRRCEILLICVRQHIPRTFERIPRPRIQNSFHRLHTDRYSRPILHRRTRSGAEAFLRPRRGLVVDASCGVSCAYSFTGSSRF